jgi:hypothetical protein
MLVGGFFRPTLVSEGIQMKYHTFPLTDIDIMNLKLVRETVIWYGKQDHSRWVFKSTRKTRFGDMGDLYFKVWNPTYIRRDNILTAIDNGFYDEQITPALTGLIFHKGICRGYVMKKCTRNWTLELDEEYDKLIKERSAKTGYFSYQYSPYHTMRYKGLPSLVDLEGFYRISAIVKLPEYHCHFDYKDYEDFIVDLYNEQVRVPGAQNPYIANHGRPQFCKTHPIMRGVRFLWAEMLAFSCKTKTTYADLIER